MRINTSRNIIILFVLFGLTLVPLSFTEAGSGVSLFLTPGEGDYRVGDLINVSVMINTGDETINAAKATLAFNANLEVQSVSKTGSIFGLWIEDPSYDNTAKTISFGGAGAGTTFKGAAGKLITVTFKAKNSGEGVVNFTSSLVKYGATTIGAIVTGGNYKINLPPQPETEETQKPAEESIPTLEKTTEELVPAEEEAIQKITIPEESVATREVVSRQSFLASMATVWGGTSQFALLVAIVALCLVSLSALGIKEWRLFQQKKKNSK